MTVVANPNGVLIASTLFALSGIAVLARAYLSAVSPAASDAEKFRRQNETKVAGWFGLPILGTGLFLQGVGQFVSSPLGAGLTFLLLGLAFTLLIYAAINDLLVDQMPVSQDAVAAEPARRPLPAPPKLKAVEALEVDLGDSIADTARQALPA